MLKTNLEHLKEEFGDQLPAKDFKEDSLQLLDKLTGGGRRCHWQRVESTEGQSFKVKALVCFDKGQTGQSTNFFKNIELSFNFGMECVVQLMR